MEYLCSLLPVVSIDDFENPLLHLLKGNVLNVWIGSSPLLWTWCFKIIHHFLQFEEEVVFKLRPLNAEECCKWFNKDDKIGNSVKEIRSFSILTTHADQLKSLLKSEWKENYEMLQYSINNKHCQFWFHGDFTDVSTPQWCEIRLVSFKFTMKSKWTNLIIYGILKNLF